LADFDDANESTLQIFTEAWKTISMVRRDSPFILWLKAVAIYSSLQKIRSRDQSAFNKKTRPTRKGLSFIDQEIISLPESERIVFVLKDIENYKKEEISDLLSMAKEEVESNLKKARDSIMNSLVIKSSDALKRALNQIPETVEPLENLYARFIDEISKIKDKDKTKNSYQAVNSEIKGKDKNTDQEKKRFSIKRIFKKKE
jgi:RNA polymerase sigma-70 factor (ECF subfamily)